MMTPKFTFYSSRDLNKLLETQFLKLGIYEVADAKAESRPDVDWGALFRSENEYPLTCWRMTAQQQQWSQLKESTKKLIHLERTITKKREWQRLMQTHMLKNQLSKSNMETTQKTKNQDNPRYSLALSQRK